VLYIVNKKKNKKRGVAMARPCGMQDSRPEARKPKPGKIDRMVKGKSVSPVPTGSEAFADRVGGKDTAWRGNKDNR